MANPVSVLCSGGERGGDTIIVDLDEIPLMGIAHIDIPDESGGVRYYYRVEQMPITYQGVYTGLDQPIPEE